MQVTAVAAVDQRHLRVHGSRHRRALDRVTDRNDIRVAADDRNGVLQVFTLGNGGIHRIVKADGSAAQLEHRRLERHLRPGARLIKERRQNLAVAGMPEIRRTLHDLSCFSDQLVNLFNRHRFKID